MSAVHAFGDEDDGLKNAFWVHCHDDAGDRHSPYAPIEWLFDQRLPRCGVALLLGPSEIGKTFLAIDLARAVATGGDYFGVKAKVQAGALIFAGEDAEGVRQRLLSLGDRDLAVRAAHVRDLRSHETQRYVRDLIYEARRAFREKKLMSARGIGLVVIDTLSASGLLVDENSNSNCAEAMLSLSAMAREHQCLIVVLHHPGKKDGGPRGGSALFASADVVIEVRPGRRPGVATVECVKNRNGPRGTWGSFTLEPCVIARDRDGREITTLRVALSDDASGAPVSTELTSSIVAAIGTRSMRKDPQSADSVHPLIADCAKIDFAKAGARCETKAILASLLASGALAEKSEYIGGKFRPMIFVPPDQRAE